MIKLLEDKSEFIISEAVRGLGSADPKSVENTINQLKNHPHGEVRRLVSFVLFGVDDHTSPEALVALSTAREGMVRLAATQALTSILNPPPGEKASARTPVGMPVGGPRGEAQLFDENEDFESVGYGRASGQTLHGANYENQGYHPTLTDPKRSKRAKLYTFIAGGVLLAILLVGILYVLQRIDQKRIDEQTQAKIQEKMPDLNPEQMIDTKAKSRMFGDRRAAQVLSMLTPYSCPAHRQIRMLVYVLQNGYPRFNCHHRSSESSKIQR